MKYQDQLDTTALEQYASALNARAKQTRAAGRLSAFDLRDRILASGGRCEWCGTGLVNAAFELDHIISLKHRGSNTAENLAVACPDCNRQKSHKHPARFAAEISVNSGRKTALVERILQFFVMEPVEQTSLFAESASKPASSAGNSRDDLDEPHYRW